MEEYDKILEELKECSPTELSQKLSEVELFDQQSSIEMLNEIYEQFDSDEKMNEQILAPVITAVIDGFMEGTQFGRKMRKKGLTSTRIFQDCESFSYESWQGSSGFNNPYTEYKSAREYTEQFGEEVRPKYDRSLYDDGSKAYYKARAVQANGGHVNLEDEYTKERNITASRTAPDQRRNDPTHRFQAQPDHVVPLKRIHEQLKGDYGLTDADIARIANSDDNFRLTAAYINQGEKGKGGKKDMTNSEFVADQRKRKAEGRPHLGLSEETLERMLQAEKEAQESINSQVNKTVGDNILGKGVVDPIVFMEAVKEAEEKAGRKLTEQEKDVIEHNLAHQKQGDILGTTAKNAADQAKDYLVGNLILYIIKPLYFELKDMFKNGVAEGVNAPSTMAGLTFRFNRIKNYVITNAVSFLGNSGWDFVKGFISSFVEGIISLFVGMFKRILKLVKEGIKIFIQASKVLFGKDAKQRTQAEKGDAIIKLIGASITQLGGIVIEDLINKIGIMEPWSVILATMLSGIASALFMYLLNKLDLFSVKAEKRRERVEEIFQLRIDDIRLTASNYGTAALEVLRQQEISFNTIKDQILEGFSSNCIEVVNDGLNKLAEFLHVELLYNDEESFADYMDNNQPDEL